MDGRQRCLEATKGELLINASVKIAHLQLILPHQRKEFDLPSLFITPVHPILMTNGEDIIALLFLQMILPILAYSLTIQRPDQSRSEDKSCVCTGM